MAGEGAFNLPDSRSGAGNSEEKGQLEDKLKLSGYVSSGNQVKNKKAGSKRKPAASSKSSKPRSGNKRVPETAPENSSGPFKKRKSSFEESGSSDLEGDNDDAKGKTNVGKSGVEMQTKKAEKGRYSEGVVRAEDWSGDMPQLRPRKKQQQSLSNLLLQDITLTEADAQKIVGRRIKVFWPLDDDWYFGRVNSFDRNRKRHHVVYEDGDEEWLELGKEKFKIQLYPGDVFGKTGSVVQLGDVEVRRVDHNRKNRRKKSDGPVNKKNGRKRTDRPVNKKNGRKSTDGPVNKKNARKSTGGSDNKKNGRGRTDGTAGDIKKRKDGPVDDRKDREGTDREDEEDGKNNDIGEDKNQPGKGKNDEDDAKKPKSLKQTAPRSKRARSTKQYNQKQGGQNQTEHVNVTEESMEDIDRRLDSKQDGDSDAKKQVNPACISFNRSDETDGIGGGRHHYEKQTDDLPKKSVEASDLGISEVQQSDLLEVKRINHTYEKDSEQSKEVDEIKSEKQPGQAETLDENEPSMIQTDQLDKNETAERQHSNQANQQDEKKTVSETRPKLTNQLDEQQSDIRGSDEKVDEKQSYGRGNDEKVDKRPGDLDLASVLGKQQGTKKQRSRVKVRTRDSILAQANQPTLNVEGQSASRQYLRFSPSREVQSTNRQSNL